MRIQLTAHWRSADGRALKPGEYAVPGDVPRVLANYLVETEQCIIVEPDPPAVVFADGGAVEVPAVVDYDALTKADLEALAEERGLTVTGTGSKGAVTKADLINALQAG